jgi:hypothetical protein
LWVGFAPAPQALEQFEPLPLACQEHEQIAGFEAATAFSERVQALPWQFN